MLDKDTQKVTIGINSRHENQQGHESEWIKSYRPNRSVIQRYALLNSSNAFSDMWRSLALLVVVFLLLGRALWIWRQQGWRRARQQIVMFIVLAAALQMVNLTFVLRGA